MTLTIGIFSIVGAFKRKSTVNFYLEQRKIFPTQPENWQKDWKEGRVKSSVKDEATSILMLFIFLVMALFVLYSLKDFSFLKIKSIWNDPNSGPTVIFGSIFGGLFLIGVIYFSFHEVIKGTIQRIKYGRGILNFNGPLKSGSKAEFNIQVSKKLKLTQIKVTLTCQKVITGRSESLQNMIEKEEVLWSDSKDVSVDTMGTTRLYFEIIKDLPKTKLEYPKVEWIVKVEELGKNESPYEVSFFVPVGK